MIISASRRTDIPAHFFRPFLNRMKAGFIEVKNPFDARRVRRVSLLPEDVDLVVFWTKNAGPMLNDLDEFESYGIPYLVLHTLTPYGPSVEPRLPPKDEIVRSFLRLADRIGPERISWRYDPIILTPELNEEYHLRRFSLLAEKLDGAARRCIVSFVSPYPRIRRNLESLRWTAPLPEARRSLAGRLAEIASSRSMSLKTCAEPEELNFLSPIAAPPPDVPRAGACIDGGLASRIAGKNLSPAKDKNQRTACLCAASTDIGTYGTCLYGCIYCYAGGSKNNRDVLLLKS